MENKCNVESFIIQALVSQPYLRLLQNYDNPEVSEWIKDP